MWSESTARPDTEPGTGPVGAPGRAGEEFWSLASRVSLGVLTVSTFSTREPTLPDTTCPGVRFSLSLIPPPVHVTALRGSVLFLVELFSFLYLALLVL